MVVLCSQHREVDNQFVSRDDFLFSINSDKTIIVKVVVFHQLSARFQRISRCHIHPVVALINIKITMYSIKNIETEKQVKQA